MKKAIRAVLRGVVQGVGYRFYCSQAAQRLNLSGYVMNLDDGSVETEAHGGAEAVDSYMKEIVKRGMGFEVDTYTAETIEYSGHYKGFTIRQY